MDAVIAVANYASGKRPFLKGLAMRTLRIHLGLKGVTVGAYVLNPIHSGRNRAVVSVTCGAGGRTEIAADHYRVVVNAGVVLRKLIGRDPVLLHVGSVRVASRAGLGNVDCVHRGTGITWWSQIVDAMTIRAYGCSTACL